MRAAAPLLLIFCVVGCATSRRAHTPLAVSQHPSPEEVIASQADLWGDAALHQPDGPTYDFFANLLPPLRYVDADFHHYPILLSAPGAMVKARVLSNGSAINAIARQPNWKNERGVPVHVLVGAQREEFGADLSRLTGPELAAGSLPAVTFRYTQGGDVYGEEVFAAVDPPLAAAGAVLAKFQFPAADRGRIELRFETGGEFPSDDGSTIRDAAGTVLARYDQNWEFNKFRSSLTSKERHAAEAVVMIMTPAVDGSTTRATRPAAVEEEAAGRRDSTSPRSDSRFEITEYRRQRELLNERWSGIVANATRVLTPERVVNDAARTLLVQQYEILAGDHLNYSASNQYARMYSNECGDSMRSLLLWGDCATARRVIPPLFVYRRQNIELHDAAFKLQLLADYFLYTRDASLVREIRPLWQREVDLILNSREKHTGLLPREKYCSDIDTPVHSLNANANCWRGLRDMSVVLADIGETEQAAKLAAVAAEYRKVILAAMDKAIVRTVNPPFLPVALDGEEPPPNPITATRLGSYWNLVIPCVLWSGVFPIDSPPADAIIDYVRTNGGLCMGMTRVQSARGVWINTQNIDDLYGLRYQLAVLRRDRPGDADRFLVGFYGKLAQGMTRDTFEDGESSAIVPLDPSGRQFALPPNSAANASYLIQLRTLLVQDWDTDDDGRADSLRLAFATPRAWLEDGKDISVREAPTQFGNVSFDIHSNLSQRRIEAEIVLPERRPRDIRLRLRVPSGWAVTGATAGDAKVPVSSETLDLSAISEHQIHITATLRRGR